MRTAMKCCGVILALLLLGCVVKRKCFSDSDCSAPEICSAEGRCALECSGPGGCPDGFDCVESRCRPHEVPQIECPGDMSPVANSYCMDTYEASRTDATAADEGTEDSRAVSIAGVLPWNVLNNRTAERACEAAGKRLCTAGEWDYACKGSQGFSYVYGNTYDPMTCNGLDTYGPADVHVMPTGSFPGCVDQWGVFDLSGNFYEHIAGGDDTKVRGGSYKSADSMMEHRCDFMPTTFMPCSCSLGFRCCLTPAQEDDEGGEPVPDAPDPAEPDAHEGGDVSPEVPDATDEGGEDIAPDGELPPSCPAEMVRITTYCLDRYEVSRSDSTDTVQGTSTVPTVRPNALPWDNTTLDGARAACQSVEKHLCTVEEWTGACGGSSGLAYTYGNDYSPTACNGVDAFCFCDEPACSGLATCPYPHCFNMPSPEGGGPCGSDTLAVPAGSMPGCVNDFGARDMSGNSWELVDGGDSVERFMGGGYNAVDSVVQTRCDFTAPSELYLCPCSRGFRCCKEI